MNYDVVRKYIEIIANRSNDSLMDSLIAGELNRWNKRFMYNKRDILLNILNGESFRYNVNEFKAMKLIINSDIESITHFYNRETFLAMYVRKNLRSKSHLKTKLLSRAIRGLDIFDGKIQLDSYMLKLQLDMNIFQMSKDVDLIRDIKSAMMLLRKSISGNEFNDNHISHIDKIIKDLSKLSR